MASITKSYGKLIRSAGDLCAFVVVCRHGSLTRAAQELGVSQPSLSKRIQNLEHVLQSRLLVRSSTGVSPTEAGKSLLDVTAEPLDLVATRLALHQGGADARRVLIHVDYAFAAYWLLPRLPRLREHVGELDIRVLASQEPRSGATEGADLAIYMAQDSEIGTRSDATLLFREAVSAIASPALLEEIGPIESPGDLLRHGNRLVHLASVGPGTPWLNWSGWFSAQGLEAAFADKETVFNTYELVMRATIAGQGVALGWHGLIESYLASGELVTVLPERVTAQNGYYIQSIADHPKPAAKRLRDWIIAEADTPAAH